MSEHNECELLTEQASYKHQGASQNENNKTVNIENHRLSINKDNIMMAASQVNSIAQFMSIKLAHVVIATSDLY